MKEYPLKYSDKAVADLVHLATFATRQHTLEFAIKYLARLRREIETLSYLADSLPESSYGIPRLYHPNAKTMTVGNHKLTVIFHTDGAYVIVDKILPSAMMKY